LRLLGGHHYDYQQALEKYGYALIQPMPDIHVSRTLKGSSFPQFEGSSF
jgi:hypothetical protein